MTDLDKRMQGAYSTVAPRYAQVNAVMPPAVEEAAYGFIDLLPGDVSGSRILDLGCGCGRDLAWFTQKGYRVTGIDLSLDMLLQARALDLPALTQANMLNMPVKSKTFDGVWANASLLHIPKDLVESVLQECHRVLRDGALLFVALQVGDAEVWEDVSYDQQAPRFFARYQPDEFCVILEQVGFSIQRFDEQKSNPKRHWMHFCAYKNSMMED